MPGAQNQSSMLLKELASTGAHVPEIGFGTWNYKRGAEPLRAAMQYGACLIDTAQAYGTEEIVGQAIKGATISRFSGD